MDLLEHTSLSCMRQHTHVQHKAPAQAPIVHPCVTDKTTNSQVYSAHMYSQMRDLLKTDSCACSFTGASYMPAAAKAFKTAIHSLVLCLRLAPPAWCMSAAKQACSHFGLFQIALQEKTAVATHCTPRMPPHQHAHVWERESLAHLYVNRCMHTRQDS